MRRLALVIGCALLAATPALAQGNGKGNGGGGGGGGNGGGGDPPPPADPAIAFVGGSNQMLGVMNADGTNVTALGIEAAWDPVWLPDLDGDPGNGYQGTLAFTLNANLDLWLADIRVVDGTPVPSGVRQVAPSYALYPAWSPDLDDDAPGYQGALAFVDFEHLFSLDVAWDGDAAEPSTVHGQSVTTLLSEQLVAYSAWSPDGDRIAFSRLLPGATYELCVLNLQDGGVAAIEQAPDVLDPEWSHDGSVIVFTVGGDIRLADPDTPGAAFSTGLVGRSPTFSPDDGALAFHIKVGAGNAIKRADLSTGEQAVLLSGKKVDFWWPDWRD